MPFFVIPSRRTRQPQGAAQLRQQYANATVAFVGSNPAVDCIGNTFATVGAASTVANRGGLNRYVSGSGNRLESARSFSPPSLASTFIYSGYVQSLATTARLFHTATVATTNDGSYTGFVFGVTTGGALDVSGGNGIASDASGRFSYLSGNSEIAANVPFTFAFRPDSVTTATAYINGKKLTFTTSGSASTYDPGSGPGLIGSLKLLSTYYYGSGEGCASLVVLPVGLPDSALRDLSLNPWQLFADVRRIHFGAGGGTTTVTGTATITPSPQTATAAGAVAIAGTFNRTPSAQTVTGASAVAIAGTFNRTPAAQTVTASGTVASGVTGTASITPAAQTVTASGSVALAATATITPSAQTLTGAGALAVAGTATITPAAQTITASGTIVSGVVGTASITPAAQTASGAGTVAIAATASITPAAQTLTGAATVSGGAVTGTANVFVSAQTLVSAANIVVVGTATITPAAQTLVGREEGTTPDEVPESSRTWSPTQARLGSSVIDGEPARLGGSTIRRTRPRLG